MLVLLALIASASGWVYALRPCALRFAAGSERDTEVTLVSVSTTGSESRVSHTLPASTRDQVFALPLPESEIDTLRIEIPAGSALGISKLTLLDRMGWAFERVSPHYLKALPGARLKGKGFSKALVSTDAKVPAAATLDVDLFAGGRREASLFWLPLCVALIGLALDRSRSLLRPLARPWIRRCALALLALAVLTGTGVMSYSSPPKVHPDEGSHLMSAAFYKYQWLPAPVGDPRLEATMIPYWGRTYLFELDVVYFAAGKFTRITGLTLMHACRLLQWLLLAGVLALAVWFLPTVPALAVVCGLTPQAWYVFSYFNGDAWPLCIALVASLILCFESLPARLVEGRGSGRALGLSLALLLGVLLVSKANYRLFVAWAMVVLAIRLWRHVGKLFAAPTMRAFALVCGPALALFVLRAGYEEAINGFERRERIEAYVESHAALPYRPSSARTGQAHSTMYQRESGVSLGTMLRRGWFESSLESSLGVYEYGGLRAPESYYKILGAALLVLCGVLALATWSSGVPGARLVLGVTLAGVVLAFAQSIYYSWNYNLQPQGRYLFPILPMLVVALESGVRRMSGRLLVPLALFPCALGVWSFVVIALAGLER